MTSEELTRRWLTPEGERLRTLVIEGCHETSEWETLLNNFPGAAELPDQIDLRGIDLRDQRLNGAEFCGLALEGACFDRCELRGADFQASGLYFAKSPCAITQLTF